MDKIETYEWNGKWFKFITSNATNGNQDVVKLTVYDEDDNVIYRFVAERFTEQRYLEDWGGSLAGLAKEAIQKQYR